MDDEGNDKEEVKNPGFAALSSKNLGRAVASNLNPESKSTTPKSNNLLKRRNSFSIEESKL
jgi:hypothetical protein